MNQHQNGFIVGGDVYYSPQWMWGVSCAYSIGDTRTDNPSNYHDSQLKTTSFQPCFYSVYSYQEWSLNTRVFLGYDEYESSRRLTDGSVSSQFDGFRYGVSLTALRAFDYKKWRYSPYIGLHFLNLSRDAYTERESAVSFLEVDESQFLTFYSQLGMSMKYIWLTGDYGQIYTDIRCDYQYEFQSTYRCYITILSGGNTSCYTYRFQSTSFFLSTVSLLVL